MRELIALRAKIDLMHSDSLMTMDENLYSYGYRDGLQKVMDMIDEMVGKQLEEMYAEHIQEANGQTD